MTRQTNARQTAGEALPRPCAPRIAYAPVTTRRNVQPLESGDPCLFAVQAGIPIADALDQLGSLLRSAQGSAADVADAIDRGAEPADAWASVRLLSFARAVVTSVMGGVIDAEAATDMQNEGGEA